MSDVGQARNIYFPFDVSSDTAVDVAGEMVKELEITDWKSIEIAEMIDEEISALVPSWKGCPMGFHQQRQHSFRYDQDDDDNDHSTLPPFHSLSSQHSSSQASLPGLFTSGLPEWIQGRHYYYYCYCHFICINVILQIHFVCSH